MSEEDPYDKLRILQEDLEDLQERVDELEQRVATLEGRATGRDSDGLDQYDGQVIDMMDPARSYSKLEIRRLYERAGVRNVDKIKSRVRHLREEGVLENNGRELRLAQAI